MKLDTKSSLADVAVAVGDALRRAGIQAVLTGGACADLYARGASPSYDADFIVSGRVETRDVDRALAPLGFARRGDHYVHRILSYHVEFPGGQLAIGQDFSIRPVLRRRKGATTLALSATDSCRDRLAWFYHNDDRQSLKAAVAIARTNKVSLPKIRAWSREEGQAPAYRKFLRELRRAREASRAGRDVRAGGTNRGRRR